MGRVLAEFILNETKPFFQPSLPLSEMKDPVFLIHKISLDIL